MPAAKHNTGADSPLPAKRRRMVLALAGGSALLLLAALVSASIMFFFAAPKTPPPAALQAAIAAKLAALHGNRYTITAFNPGQPDSEFRYHATLTARLADTLYAPVDTIDYIQNQMRLDTSAERKIEQILAAPGGARIRELAALDATAGTLASTQLVRETAHAGARCEFRATLAAQRDTTAAARGGWRLDILALTPQTPLPEGAPLAQFTGRRLLDITRESDLATLRRLVAQTNDALRRVEQARDRYRAELAADTARATAAYLALLAPRALFTGTATLPRRQAPAPPISLEIQTLDRAARPAPRVTALLRTDNSWNDARRLEGHCAYDLAANAFVLTLAAPAGPALTSTRGALLANANPFKLTLRLTPDAELTGGPASPRAWTCRLSRVPDAARDATIATLNANSRKLLEVTRPGTVYRAHLAADTPIPAPMLLRITAQDSRTRTITATLEDTVSDWTRELRGTADDNIFRAAGYPIRFTNASLGNDNPPVVLNLRFPSLDANALEGTLSLPYEPLAIALVPADDQYLAQVAAQKAANRRAAAEQARLDHLVTHPALDTLPPADGAYLWRSGLWLPLPRNDARVVRSALQKIGGIWSAALSLVKTRADKQDTGTLTFDGPVPPPAATAADQLIILAYRGPMKIYAGADVPPDRIPIEIAPLELKNNGRLRTAELTRLGDAAATLGATAIAATIERPAPPAAADIYLIRITHPLPPGRYALAAPDQHFEFEIRAE